MSVVARPARPLGLLIVVLLTLPALAGCEPGGLMGVLTPNQRPTVSISQPPPARSDPSSYVWEISWMGADVDGRVVGFRYAIDPPSRAGSDTAWVVTTVNRKVFSFTSDSVVNGRAHRFHTFVVESIDDRDAHSAPAYVSFDATTLAPTVSITSPVPSALLTPQVSPSLRVSWSGSDPDGRASRLPASYRWRLFGSSSEPTMDVILTNPDTLPALFAPTFAGWDSLGGGATSLALRDMNTDERYLFAIVAIDEAGAWSPVFTLYDNLLQFRVNAAADLGPRITFYNDAFRYEFASGGTNLDAETWPRMEFPASVPVVVNWSAVTTNGAFVRGARWAVDIASTSDETPRTNEATDIEHWSRWTTGTTLVIPGLDPPPGSWTSSHRLYLEVEDNIGQVSLVGLHMTVVRPSFARDLLVVDDTFFPVDRQAAGGCVAAPAGAWPTAAELDTFLCAVGDAPWKCYPAGTRSTPGLLAGYDFDTIGTHTLRVTEFTLAKLSRYRNILWMVDAGSAFGNNQPFSSTVQPMPMLRYLAQPGVYNPLVMWLQQGGRLWLMGGGASYASLIDFNVLGTSMSIFSSANGELAPGRLMYSFVHWRSETETYRSAQARRSARAVGGWPGAPDYSALPAQLSQKTVATDPVPPLRMAATFYATQYYSEYLTLPNSILERVPGAFPDSFYTTLDTLYETVGAPSGTGRPLMTLYHGAENSQVVFSGFPVWYFQRPQAIALVDFVFQRVWGMTRRPVPR